MTKALEQIPTDAEHYYEREIRATFESGGKIEVRVCGDSVGEVLSILMATLRVLPLNGAHTFHFTLSYWHLTEDCDSFEISSSATEVDTKELDLHRTVRRMVRRTKLSFLSKLALAQIALVGPRGAVVM